VEGKKAGISLLLSAATYGGTWWLSNSHSVSTTATVIQILAAMIYLDLLEKKNQDSSGP
tara:strand:+ start:515 stop:691 length:177 start_codon:yes stop_codon:yes gene_type:complete